MNSKPVNYKEAVEYIESIPKFTQKHTQEHTREFLERLGRPAFDREGGYMWQEPMAKVLCVHIFRRS